MKPDNEDESIIERGVSNNDSMTQKNNLANLIDEEVSMQQPP
jgi:hypothetical protein